MEPNEFVTLLAEQLEETNPSEITANTTFKELNEWHSLTAFVIIGMAKEPFGKAVNGWRFGQL